MKKKILKHPLVQALAAWLLAGVIRLAFITSSKKRHIHPEALPYMRGEKNAIFAFWHGRMMLMPCFEPPGRKMRVLISGHRDGQLISKVIAHFGEETITGSSSRGGRGAVAALMQALEKGENISITPDGPRGPFQEAAPGITRLAAMTGYPIIPVTYSSSHHKRLRSWDRFMLALPFGHVIFLAGAPITAAPEVLKETPDAIRDALQAQMRLLTHYADEGKNLDGQ